MPPYPTYQPQVPIPGGIPPDYVYGGGSAPPPTAPAIPTPAPAPAAPAPAPAAAARPPAAAKPTGTEPVQLSDFEQASILAMLDKKGWRIVGNAAVPLTKSGTNAKNESINVPTGEYTIQLQDPAGNYTPAQITKGAPGPAGEPVWVAGSKIENAPKPASADASTVPAADGSIWEKDANGKWQNTGLPQKVSNPDVDKSLALKAQEDQAQIDKRRANDLAGKGYLTDEERFTHDEALRRVGVDEDKIKIDRDEFALKKLNDDAKRQPEINQIKANTDLATANANLAGANVNRIGSEIDIPGQAAPGNRALTASQTANQVAQTSEAYNRIKIANAPGVIANVGTGPNIYQSDPTTGALSTSLNQNYQPKTQAEIAARVGQLNNQAVAKKQELMAKVSATYTADQAMQDWSNWWDANIESQKPSLDQAQQEAQFQRTKDEAAMRTSAYTAASAAGTLANTAMNDQAARTVGPGAREASAALLGGATKLTPEMAASQFYKAPNQADAAHNAVMEALKYISPGAAAANGLPTPSYSSVDIQGGLNRSNYWPGGGAPPPVAGPAPGGPPPATGGPPAPEAPPPPPPPAVDPNAWYQAWRGRQAKDVAEQQAQAAVAGSPDQWQQWVPNYAPSF